MRISARLAASAGLLQIALCSGALADDWRVTRLSGQAMVFYQGKWTPLVLGDIVADAAAIRTLANGSLQFERDRETIEVEPDTEIRIVDKPGRRYTTVNQYFGAVGIEANRENVEHFAVKTPYLAAVVKGTIFAVHTVNKVSAVAVTRGMVGVQGFNGLGQGDVTAGQTATVSAKNGFSMGNSASSASASAANAAAATAAPSVAAAVAAANTAATATAAAATSAATATAATATAATATASAATATASTASAATASAAASSAASSGAAGASTSSASTASTSNSAATAAAAKGQSATSSGESTSSGQSADSGANSSNAATASSHHGFGFGFHGFGFGFGFHGFGFASHGKGAAAAGSSGHGGSTGSGAGTR